MSSYGQLYVGSHHLMSFRNELDPTFMLLFNRKELRRTHRMGSERPALGYDAAEEYEAFEFAIPTDALSERLDVLGVGIRAAEDVFREVVAESLSMRREWAAERGVEHGWAKGLQEEIEYLERLDFRAWQSEVRERLDAGDSPHDRRPIGSLGSLLELWEDVDARFALRAISEVFPGSEIVLDVTDLAEGGWFDTEQDPRELALDHFGYVLTNGAPVIVLTEGSTDADVLSTALGILRPHLVGFIRFADFSVGAEGGAGALVRLLKALWAAGIANRVVAIFDNDTAGADALRSLDTSALPPNLKVMSLPSLSLGGRYPTIGPSGPTEMDINGLAGSIELYLGEDVLRGDDGELRPVQWTGYVPRLGRYQGEIVGKKELLARFSAKADAAVNGGVPLDAQDWSGLRLILDSLVSMLKA